jgi:hypothetical protein
MSRPVLPYLVADRASVTTDGWRIEENGAWTPLPAALADWDYNTDLHLQMDLVVDHDRFLHSTGLDELDPLRWSVSWRAVDGRIGKCAYLAPAMLDGPVSFDVSLPGPQLGPIVQIAARLVLAAAPSVPRPGRASLPGSILWERHDTLSLVGDLARFPVVVTDFAASGLDVDASWTLEIADLSAPVLGGLLLLINVADVALVKAVTRDAKAGEELRDHLHEGVAIRLLDHAVVHADVLSEQDWDEGTLGRSLRLLVARSELGLGALCALRERRPAAYQAALVGEARRNGAGRLLK